MAVHKQPMAPGNKLTCAALSFSLSQLAQEETETCLKNEWIARKKNTTPPLPKKHKNESLALGGKVALTGHETSQAMVGEVVLRHVRMTNFSNFRLSVGGWTLISHLFFFFFLAETTTSTETIRPD